MNQPLIEGMRRLLRESPDLDIFHLRIWEDCATVLAPSLRAVLPGDRNSG
jgi:hypothetical protein